MKNGRAQCILAYRWFILFFKVLFCFCFFFFFRSCMLWYPQEVLVPSYAITFLLQVHGNPLVDLLTNRSLCQKSFGTPLPARGSFFSLFCVSNAFSLPTAPQGLSRALRSRTIRAAPPGARLIIKNDFFFSKSPVSTAT